MTPQERFAANLRLARTKAGISQEELGNRCELHRTEISLLERAGREPRLSTIVKLAGSLETTPGALRGRRLAAIEAALRRQAATASQLSRTTLLR
jgi:transcriptional regulator with XRE-family HTH domain